MDIQEAQWDDPAPSKQKRVIHFSSGETLELEDSEEEEEGEQSSSTPPFTEPSDKTKFSFKKLAVLVGRISLLTCDFLGERLAGALGLNAPKYQYAVDRYQRDHKKKSGHATDDHAEAQAETTCHYGATSGVTRPAGPHSSVEKHREQHKEEGYHNKGYQVDDDYLN